MPQQQQQTNLKPIAPKKIGFIGSKTGTSLKGITGNELKGDVMKKMPKKPAKEGIVSDAKRYAKVANSVRTTMGYGKHNQKSIKVK